MIPLLEQLYREIEHGDKEHREWLYNKIEEFSKKFTQNMNFGQALDSLKSGNKVQRSGWNGKNQFIVMMPALYLPPYNTQGTERKVNDRTAKWIGEDQPLDCQPYIAIYNAQKKWQPGWIPSQGDLFAEDWNILP